MIPFQQYIEEVRNFKLRPNKLASLEQKTEKVGDEYVRKMVPVAPKYMSGTFARDVDNMIDIMKKNPDYKPGPYFAKRDSKPNYKPIFQQSYTPGVVNRHDSFYDRLIQKSGNTLKQISKRTKEAIGAYTSTTEHPILSTYIHSLFNPTRKRNAQREILDLQSHRHPSERTTPKDAHNTLENLFRAKRFVAPHDMVLYRITEMHPHEHIAGTEKRFGNVLGKNKRETRFSTNRTYSFTSNPQMLQKFYGKNRDNHLIRLHVPKGTHLYVPHQHSHYEENEFILPPTSVVHMHNKPRKHDLMSSDAFNTGYTPKSSKGAMWTASVKQVPSKLNILRHIRSLRDQ